MQPILTFVWTENLCALQDSISTGSASTANEPSGQTNSWSIDSQLLWDTLIYEKAGRRNAKVDLSMFGDTIAVDTEHNSQDVAEFDMVGSAGLSGHKAAWKQVSAFAPGENDPYLTAQPQRAGMAATVTSTTTQNNHVLDGFGAMEMMDQGNFLLQAEDFGRAVNDWIDFDMADISYDS